MKCNLQRFELVAGKLYNQVFPITEIKICKFTRSFESKQVKSHNTSNLKRKQREGGSRSWRLCCTSLLVSFDLQKTYCSSYTAVKPNTQVNTQNAERCVFKISRYNENKPTNAWRAQLLHTLKAKEHKDMCTCMLKLCCISQESE